MNGGQDVWDVRTLVRRDLTLRVVQVTLRVVYVSQIGCFRVYTSDS